MQRCYCIFNFNQIQKLTQNLQSTQASVYVFQTCNYFSFYSTLAGHFRFPSRGQLLFAISLTQIAFFSSPFSTLISFLNHSNLSLQSFPMAECFAAMCDMFLRFHIHKHGKQDALSLILHIIFLCHKSLHQVTSCRISKVERISRTIHRLYSCF